MSTPEDAMTCDKHPRYKAIRKPRPGCVICHAMWQVTLVQKEVKDKRRIASSSAAQGMSGSNE